MGPIGLMDSMVVENWWNSNYKTRRLHTRLHMAKHLLVFGES